MTPLQIASAHIGSGIGSLGNAATLTTPSLAGGRFDPANFGTAIMNAARDGVDRFGSPALGASTSASPAPGQMQGGDGEKTTNLNENLKNIGKFFRRDVGGFGRFGRAHEEGKS